MSSCAYALVNGMQLLQCVLPTASEGTCAVETDAQPNLAVMDDFGHFEISCLFYAGTAPSGTPQERAYVGELVVDGESIQLGQLPDTEGESNGTSPSVIVTRQVAKYPSVLEFRLRYSQRATYEHPDEAELIHELKELLTDRTIFPQGGSAPHTNVHNRLKDLELYNRVVTQHYGGKWTAFLANHSDEILMRKQPGQELHLMLTGNKDTFSQVDDETEEHRMAQENEVVQYMVKILSERDYEYRDLLERMAQLPAFTMQLTPSMTMLVRFLQSNRDVFWIKKDPEHTTRVGLVRR